MKLPTTICTGSSLKNVEVGICRPKRIYTDIFMRIEIYCKKVASWRYYRYFSAQRHTKGPFFLAHFLGFFYVLYSTLVHKPPLRSSGVGGNWDRTRTVGTLALAVRRSHHSPRSHPHSARSHPLSARSHPHSARYHPHSARPHPHSARSHP